MIDNYDTSTIHPYKSYKMPMQAHIWAMSKNVNAKHSSTEPSDRGRAFSATDEDLAPETDRKPANLQTKLSSKQTWLGYCIQCSGWSACRLKLQTSKDML